MCFGPIVSEKHHFLELFIISGSYTLSGPILRRSLSSEGSGLRKTFHLVLQGLLLSAPCTAVGLCVSFHLLHEEVSLMMADQGADLWL